MSNKIIVLGLGQNNFLSFLYGKLKTKRDSYTISAPYYRNLKKEVKYDSWMYDNSKLVYQKDPFSYIKTAFFLLTSKHFYQTFFFILLVDKKIGKALHFIASSFKEKVFFTANNNFKTYDTFHFHFMQYSYLREVFFVPKGKNIVCTFWGSDLLRTSDLFNHYFVKKALNTATTITCQSLEMREIILSKYGRNLASKVHLAIFPLEERMFKELDQNFENTTAINDFKRKYSFSFTKYNVLVGHNGSPFNNHLDIIKGLKDSVNKDKIHVIINLNYAISQSVRGSYKNKLVLLLESLGITYTILEEYYSLDELTFSRLATDFFIHMPTSDSFSNTMIEFVYAKKLVITGAWLPYKTFVKNGLKYYEIDTYEEIANQLDTLILNYDNEKIKLVANTEIIAKAFLGNSFITNWEEIL